MSRLSDELQSIQQARKSRRRFLQVAGLASAAVGTGMLGAGQKAEAVEATAYGPRGHRFIVNDIDIGNFALNLEYLEAEFYLRAVTGSGLAASEISGSGEPGSYLKPKSATPGAVNGGTQVPFVTSAIQAYAQQIANDEHAHVLLLRSVLGKDAVARPAIDFTNAFTAAAVAAGIIASGQTFNPFANEDDFLLGAFVFEDVGVTAYHGAAPFIHSSAILAAAAGVLGTEAYHAANIRTQLNQLNAANPGAGLAGIANKISALRAAADTAAGGTGHDAGITDSNNVPIIAPVDSNGVTYARTFPEVLNIVYLNATANTVTSGGFFPAGMNGRIF